MAEPTKAYLVCATQRSGSTLLCELLKETGVAGRPEEFFEAMRDTGLPPHPGDYLSGLPRTGAGVRDDPTPADGPEYSSLAGLERYRDHLERTFAWGTTANGVFGAKLMFNQLPHIQALAGALPELTGLDTAELLERLFNRPAYVWVAREDKVRQAVSLWRALQTRSWRGGTGRSPDALVYRFDAIDHLVGRLEAEDRGWGEFFAGHGLEPLRLSYERDLEPGGEGTVRRVLGLLGLELPEGFTGRKPLQRQSDALSDEWVAAYHREAAP